MKIKLINKKTGVIKEVNKSLASDYIGTGEFEIYKEEKVIEKINVKNKSRNK